LLPPKKIINNDNLNRKLNSKPTIEIINNNNNNSNKNYNINNSNYSQCYKKDSSHILRNSNYYNDNDNNNNNNSNNNNNNNSHHHHHSNNSHINNSNNNRNNQKEDQLLNSFYKNPNIKIIHTKSHHQESNIKKTSESIDKIKNTKNIHSNSHDNHHINFNPSSTSYLHLNENTNTNNRNIGMKTQASIIPNLHLDSFSSINENMIATPYVTPLYYTSSVPLTSTTIATTTANINDNTTSSLLNSYFNDRNEQYLINNNPSITYIVNSNQKEKSLNPSPPSKNTTLVNTITSSKPPSLYTRTSDDNTQVKALVPMKYYTNSYINGRFYLNSNEMTSPITTTNPLTSTNSLNDNLANTQLISSKPASQHSNTHSTYFSDSIVIKNTDDALSMNLQPITSTSPHLNQMRNSVESHYTNDQEKVRGPMMYSTTTNANSLINFSPIITNIVSTSTNPNTTTTTSTVTTVTTVSNANPSTSSTVSSTKTSSAISILSTASSIHSNIVLKDTGLTCSPESTNLQDHMAKKAKPLSKHSKKKNTTSLNDKSGIIGFAAEILTSVLPTSSNNLKHPKTRYLPELYPFIKKIAHKCKIDIRTFLYALVYSQRFAEALLSHHKEAVGEYGTNHRIFLASILLAYQYQIDHGMKVNFKLDAKKLSKYTDGVWTEKEVEMMCKALISTKNFTLDINDDVVKQFVEIHKADLCWYS